MRIVKRCISCLFCSLLLLLLLLGHWVHSKLLPKMEITLQMENEMGERYKSLGCSQRYICDCEINCGHNRPLGQSIVNIIFLQMYRWATQDEDDQIFKNEMKFARVWKDIISWALVVLGHIWLWYSWWSAELMLYFVDQNWDFPWSLLPHLPLPKRARWTQLFAGFSCAVSISSRFEFFCSKLRF